MSVHKAKLNPTLKLVLDIGPLLLFFIANSRPSIFLPLLRPILPAAISSDEHVGIFVATAVFMFAIVIALAVAYALTRQLPLMPLITALVVLVFGSLTLMLAVMFVALLALAGIVIDGGAKLNRAQNAAAIAQEAARAGAGLVNQANALASGSFTVDQAQALVAARR